MKREELATETTDQGLLRLTGQIVSAYVRRNAVPAGDLPAAIKSVHGTICGLAGVNAEPASMLKPAVPIKKSIQPDYMICLEDGARLKMLKRYLRSRFDMTPEQYRAKWGLPADYPMVAPKYAAQRSAFAKKIGLGTPATSARRRRRG